MPACGVFCYIWLHIDTFAFKKNHQLTKTSFCLLKIILEQSLLKINAFLSFGFFEISFNKSSCFFFSSTFQKTKRKIVTTNNLDLVMLSEKKDTLQIIDKYTNTLEMFYTFSILFRRPLQVISSSWRVQKGLNKIT